jgi:hypothetical protein
MKGAARSATAREVSTAVTNGSEEHNDRTEPSAPGL